MTRPPSDGTIIVGLEVLATEPDGLRCALPEGPCGRQAHQPGLCGRRLPDADTGRPVADGAEPIAQLPRKDRPSGPPARRPTLRVPSRSYLGSPPARRLMASLLRSSRWQ